MLSFGRYKCWPLSMVHESGSWTDSYCLLIDSCLTPSLTVVQPMGKTDLMLWKKNTEQNVIEY